MTDRITELTKHAAQELAEHTRDLQRLLDSLARDLILDALDAYFRGERTAEETLRLLYELNAPLYFRDKAVLESAKADADARALVLRPRSGIPSHRMDADEGRWQIVQLIVSKMRDRENATRKAMEQAAKLLQTTPEAKKKAEFRQDGSRFGRKRGR